MIVSAAGVLSLCMTVSCVCVYVLCIECAYVLLSMPVLCVHVAWTIGMHALYVGPGDESVCLCCVVYM